MNLEFCMIRTTPRFVLAGGSIRVATLACRTIHRAPPASLSSKATKDFFFLLVARIGRSSPALAPSCLSRFGAPSTLLHCIRPCPSAYRRNKPDPSFWPCIVTGYSFGPSWGLGSIIQWQQLACSCLERTESRGMPWMSRHFWIPVLPTGTATGLLKPVCHNSGTRSSYFTKTLILNARRPSN